MIEAFEIFWEIILKGGPLMVPLSLIAAFIYFQGFKLFFYFRAHGFYRTDRRKWASWVLNPVQADGEIRNIVDYTQENIESPADVQSRFAEVKSAYLEYVDRQHRTLVVLITTAPLMGLLGTVTGMLTTFNGLSLSTSGKTVEMIASGISEALITTQTGLMVAIPGYVLASMILKRRNQLDACLTHLESVTLQAFEKKSLTFQL